MKCSATVLAMLFWPASLFASTTGDTPAIVTSEAASNNTGLLIEGPSSQARSISFTAFDKEFIFTNSVDDYRRSLVRLRETYRINISDHTIRSLGDSIPNETKLKLTSLSANVGKEAQAKSIGRASGFYATLQILNSNVYSVNEAAFVELQLVDLQREVNGKIVPLSDELDVTRFIYLIQHARYEIFSSAMLNER